MSQRSFRTAVIRASRSIFVNSLLAVLTFLPFAAITWFSFGNGLAKQSEEIIRSPSVRKMTYCVRMETLHRTIHLLYTGRSQKARWFRYALVLFDTLTIFYFILSVSWQQTALLSTLDTALGVLILADLLARFWISDDRRRECLNPYTVADFLVVASLLLAPLLTEDVAFLRILRGLRLIHTYHLVRDLRRESRFFQRHEDALLAAVHLFVFIFVMSSLVFVVAFGEEAGPGSYIDALYFTVATLTTTGFGDIIMTTPGGKLLAVFIMVVGVGLFLHLARAIFQPSKVRHTCPNCGQNRHDPDAIHCTHCGEPLIIETEGGTSF